MAWRPNDQFIEGELDNSVRGKVTGWMKFAGMKDRVILDLEGDFHRDIRGAKVRLRGDGESADPQKSARYMQGFSTLQKGNVGDMTAGREPADYVDYGYFEFYSETNGRVVIELEPDQVELLSKPIPACESDPIDRNKQAENMAGFLVNMAQEAGISESRAVSTGQTKAVERAKKVIANDKIRGMKLLPDEIKQQLPALYSQDGKGGKAIAYCRLFTPDSGFTWWVLEAGPITDDQGNVVDYQMFALVEGHYKELGYVSLNELEELRGLMGLPVERDLHWQPKTLEQIAPEMFRQGGD